MAEGAMIDAVLLRTLRARGMSDGVIAARAAGVVAGDARAMRHLGADCSSETTSSDGVVMAAVRLAHGIHWCGGQLRINHAHNLLPEQVKASLPGMPLSTVIRHPLLDDTLRVTRVLNEDTWRFDAGGYSEGDPKVTILETNAVPVVVESNRRSRVTARWQRVVDDQILVAAFGDRQTSRRSVVRTFVVNTLLLGVTLYVVAETCLRSAPMGLSAMQANLGAALITAAFTLLMTHLVVSGPSLTKPEGMAHYSHRKGMRARQMAEGMRDG